MGWVSSILDALSKIILDIERRTGLLMKGPVVINISLGWDGDFGENEGQLKGPLTAGPRLSSRYRRQRWWGQNSQKRPSRILPLTLLVGSVQGYGGDTLEWSRVGSAVTTNAPAYVRCAHPSPGAHNNALYSGNGYSAAMVSGVVSAWLSDEYGNELRKDPLGAPQAVKNLVKQLSYVREHGTLAGIWNGVNVKDPNAFPPKPNNWNMWRW